MKYSTLLVVSIFLIACQNNNRGNAEENTSTKKGAEQVVEPEDTVKEAPSFDLNNFQNLVEKYEDPQRANWQNPQLIINKLGELKGKTVADIGAGTGYFTFRLAEQGAKVIAIDIDTRFLDYIEERKAELENNNSSLVIETRLVDENDPSLKPHEADLALLVNTYHFLTNRADYLKKIADGLKKTGKVVIVDYKIGELPVGPSEEYKIPLDQAREEIENAGLKVLEVDSKSLNYQYIIIAKP